MSNTTIPAVIDKLVALATAACPAALVTDGYPGVDYPQNMVMVGGAVVPTETGTEIPPTLGKLAKEEDYRVECLVYCSDGGTNPEQKVVRDAAFALYNAFVNAIRADWSLGGIVLWAYVDTTSLTQTSDADAQQGRLAKIEFAVRCMARI